MSAILFMTSLSFFLLIFAGCSSVLTFPDQMTQKQRFAQLKNGEAPVKLPVQVFWDKHSIPFIEASDDFDLAFAIGIVHAHLRIDQLETMRLITQGRISEVAGPLPPAKYIDHGFRLLDLKGSAKKSLAKMSPRSKNWITRYTQGLNWYIERLQETPTTNSFTDIDLEPYTVEDVLTITRLIAADLSWGIYLKYLKMAETSGWEKVYKQSLEKLKTDAATYDNPFDGGFSKILKSFSKSGSNSLVIGKDRSSTGSALIANDPHVGLLLPNFWILVGLKSPSFHAVGYMIPGVPIIGVGRNKNIAWGGTNMRGISSHLYDVSKFDDSQITIRKERIKRRWWFDSEVNIRETKFGPILTDIGFFDSEKQPFQVALNWVGRDGTDELESFLKVLEARNWQDFQKAFRNYKVSAMNMLYADDQGNIGMVAAYGQPVLKNPEKTLDLVKSPDNPVIRIKSPMEHPNPYNPKQGYIASANNKPFSKPEIPFAYSFANNDRFNRLRHFSEKSDQIDVKKLMSLQTDVYSQTAVELQQEIRRACEKSEVSRSDIMKSLNSWDGHFTTESKGALTFYLLGYALWQDLLQDYNGQPLLQEELRDHDNWKVLLREWLSKKTPQETQQLVIKAIEQSKDSIAEHKTWGDFTKQGQKSILGMVPVIGSRFKFESVRVKGSSDTLNKYGRKLTNEPGEVTYGASSRHISDMSSLDENYFVMNGGQDSWLMNENIADQVALWKSDKYIKIPLTMAKVKTVFDRHKTVLKPD